MKLVDPGDTLPWKVCIYGDMGAGKTILACGAPKPFLCDTEKGRISILNHPELREKMQGRIAEVDDLNKDISEIVRLCNNNKPPFDDVETIIIDTISASRLVELQEEMRRQAGKNSNRNIDEPSQNEYKIINNKIARAILDLMKTDKNLVFLAHVREDRNEEGVIIRRGPGVPPAVQETISRFVDLVCFLDMKTNRRGETTRTLITKPKSNLQIKNRYGNMPEEIEDPSFNDIIQAINKQREITNA